MSDYLISEETLSSLANSVRTISNENTEMTPDQMVMTMNNTKSVMDALNEHINNKINPHGVTAAQVGADPSGTASGAVSTLSRFQSGLGNEYVWSKSAEYDADVIQRASSTTTVKITSVDSGMTVYKTATLVDGKIVLSDSEKVDYNRGSDRYLSKNGVTYLLVSLDSYANSAATYIAYVMSVGKETRQGIIGYVNSSDPNAYPVDDEYTYTPLGQLGAMRQIATGSYTGTGKNGASNPNKLTFDFVPQLFVLQGDMGQTNSVVSWYMTAVCVNGFARNMLYAGSNNAFSATFTWNGNTVSWYGNSASEQANASGRTYRYVAIG